MAFQLEEINLMAKADPQGFIQLGESNYDRKLQDAAERVAAHRKESPVVLLSGPSGSGKTTTSLKLRDALLRRGIKTHTVSLDDYFQTVSPLTSPRTPTGEYDFESPECLDMELLNEHFTALSRGETILVPHYDFPRHMRDTSRCRELTLGKDEIAVFEGIHALNDVLFEAHPEAFRIYLSARSNVLCHGEVVFKGTWMRLVRRSVRDLNFRGSEILMTLSMWDNIRRGEKLYISPYKHRADLLFDSALSYEVGVMSHYAAPIFRAIPKEDIRRREMLNMIAAFDRFVPIDPALVPEDSVLREFIGGGSYHAH
ncbi:MAG: nucleoside kinase [Clostridiales bacterium]|nr:nucleoside kinase [Clostridiales bacterium]